MVHACDVEVYSSFAAGPTGLHQYTESMCVCLYEGIMGISHFDPDYTDWSIQVSAVPNPNHPDRVWHTYTHAAAKLQLIPLPQPTNTKPEAIKPSFVHVCVCIR